MDHMRPLFTPIMEPDSSAIFLEALLRHQVQTVRGCRLLTIPKASSRKDRGGGGSSGGIEQFLLMIAENTANQTRLMEGFSNIMMRDNGPSKAVSSTDAFSHAHERNAYAKNVLALTSALCRVLTEKIKRHSVLYQMYVKAKPTGSARVPRVQTP